MIFAKSPNFSDALEKPGGCHDVQEHLHTTCFHLCTWLDLRCVSPKDLGTWPQACHLFTLFFTGSEFQDMKHPREVLPQEVLVYETVTTELSVTKFWRV